MHRQGIVVVAVVVVLVVVVVVVVVVAMETSRAMVILGVAVVQWISFLLFCFRRGCGAWR